MLNTGERRGLAKCWHHWRRGDGGVSQLLAIADKGSRGMGGGFRPPNMAHIICAQSLTRLVFFSIFITYIINNWYCLQPVSLCCPLQEHIQQIVNLCVSPLCVSLNTTDLFKQYWMYWLGLLVDMPKIVLVDCLIMKKCYYLTFFITKVKKKNTY